MNEESEKRARTGSITGPVIFDDGVQKHDLHETIWTGPSTDSQLNCTLIRHDARFILLTEKHTVFDRLVADEFHSHHSCVIATAAGYPGHRFWSFLHSVHAQMHVPFYLLADNDPAGYGLFFLITRGNLRSRGGARDALRIPNARYLGVCAGDVEHYDVDERAHIDLSEVELNEARRLRDCHWLKGISVWQNELTQLLDHGFKIEVESLITKGIDFVTREYVPAQLADKRYLTWP